MTMKQALKMLARDWRAGELRVLAAALVIAVAAITSVAFFADRISQGLARDAHQLLGADLVLVADQPWPGEIAGELEKAGVQRAQAINFISMASAKEGQLAGVKAVSENYPSARAPAHRQGAGHGRRARRARPRPRHGMARGAAGHRAAGPGRFARQARPRRVHRRRGADARARAQHQLLQHRAAADDEHRRCAGDRADPDRQPGFVLPVCGRHTATGKAVGRNPTTKTAARAAHRHAGNRPPGSALGDRPRRALPWPDRAARRGARRRRGRARHTPVRRTAPRRLRGHALPRRDAGAAPATVRH